MPSNIYILRTHFIHQVILEKYAQFIKDFGEYNVFILLDVTNIKNIEPEYIDWYNELESNGKIIKIDETKCIEINPLHNQFKEHGMHYRAEAPIAHLYRNIKREYDYMWLIEYDVYCKGSFLNALEPCNTIRCDFLSKGGDDRNKKRTYREHRSWCWFRNLFGNVDKAVKMHDRVGCFFPVNRFSRAMLEAIDENLGKGTGFCEVYFPCLCLMKNLSYEVIPEQVFGIFNFRPNHKKDVLDFTAESNKLYHPVK